LGAGLAGAVPGLPVQREGGHQVGVRLLMVTEHVAGGSPQAVRHGLPGHVAEAAGSSERGVLDRGQLVPVPAAVQAVHHGPGQLPRVFVVPGPGGQPDGGGQDLVLCVEPGQRLAGAGQLPCGDARQRRAERDRIPLRFEQQRGLAGRVQVVVQNAASGCLAPLLVLGPARLLGGVGTEQVVAAIAAG
jgi:hypothetical protein